jgi:hypothetical protein
MASKERKKDGDDTGKKRRRMREAVAERRRTAGAPRESRDEGDTIPFKRGSAEDRTQSPATKHGAK